MSVKHRSLKPIMLCLRCGYRNEDRPPGSPYTQRDKAHQQRCLDFCMTIRYFDEEMKRVQGNGTRGHRR